MKTSHFCFPSGLVEYDHEPFSMEKVLEFEGKYYVIGSGRQPLQQDKTKSENYYLLTLAAIAMELDYRHAPANPTVFLAAGLPLTRFGPDKDPFRNYLLRGTEPVTFRYENRTYSVTITGLRLFPQGYAAALLQPELVDEPSVIVADIGGWTVDLMRIDNGKPNAATCFSHEMGVIRCMDEISEQIRRKLGISMTAAQIESVMRGDASKISDAAKEIIRRETENYVSRLLSAMLESGLDYRAMPVILMGGGASLFKRHVTPVVDLCRPLLLDDVSINAKAYERLCERISERVPNG